MNTLADQVFERRDTDLPGLIRMGIESYSFLDYATVDEYKDGIVKVTLAKMVNKKKVSLSEVEVINFGSGSLQVKTELDKGDKVILVSSKSYVKTLSDIAPKNIPLPAYDVGSIKAIPISTEATTVLDIKKDGSFILSNSKMSISWDNSKLVITSNAPIELNGSTKHFVTHAELTSALNTFMQALNTHTHPTAATGSPSPPTVPMTLNIAGSKAEKVVTG